MDRRIGYYHVTYRNPEPSFAPEVKTIAYGSEWDIREDYQNRGHTIVTIKRCNKRPCAATEEGWQQHKQNICGIVWESLLGSLILHTT